MTSCFVARISNPAERFGKPFYEVDVPSPPLPQCSLRCENSIDGNAHLDHKSPAAKNSSKIKTVIS